MTTTLDLDLSVFPDLDSPPTMLVSDPDRADYIARVCGAWDFDIVPTPATFRLFATWRDVFDRYPLLDSPSYAAFRTIFRWPRLPGGRAMQADFERLDPGPDACAPLW